MAYNRGVPFKGRDNIGIMLEQDMVMTTDDLFNSCVAKDSTKVLTEDSFGYGYDAYFCVKVGIDALDGRQVMRLMRRMYRYVELNPLVEFNDIDDGYRFSVLNTTKLRNQRVLLHYINGLRNIVERALDAGAFMFVRLYEGNPSYKDKNLMLRFANVVTKDVRLNVYQLVAVLKDMLSHQCVGFCVKFE